jgi:hypothetical protein
LAECPLCAKRKGRRACPAKGEAICPQCCGSKRLVLIDCPKDCAYLGGGDASWARETDRVKDAHRLYAMAGELTQAQTRLLFLSFVGIASLRAREKDLTDERLACAVDALAKTTQTRTKGVLYEHAPDDARAQGLVHDLTGIFEAEDEGDGMTAPADRDLLAVLQALRAGLAQKMDASPHSFLDTVTRMVGRPASPPPSRGPASSRIIT